MGYCDLWSSLGICRTLFLFRFGSVWFFFFFFSDSVGEVRMSLTLDVGALLGRAYMDGLGGWMWFGLMAYGLG